MTSLTGRILGQAFARGQVLLVKLLVVEAPEPNRCRQIPWACTGTLAVHGLTVLCRLVILVWVSVSSMGGLVYSGVARIATLTPGSSGGRVARCCCRCRIRFVEPHYFTARVFMAGLHANGRLHHGRPTCWGVGRLDHVCRRFDRLCSSALECPLQEACPVLVRGS